jgi:hypothetical protein
MRPRWFVWAIWAAVALVAWQAGVLPIVVAVTVGFVLGVAATWVYARIRIGDG